MTDTIPCPSCGEILDINASSCQVCLRSRSAREIMQGIREAKPGARVKRVVTSKALRTMLFGLVTLAFVYYAHTHDLLPSGRLGKQVESKIMSEGASNTDADAAAQGGDPNNTNPEAAAAAAEEKARRAKLAHPALPRKGGAKTTAGAAEAEQEETDHRWHVQGKVYDLITLKPIGGARITFAGDEIIRTRSGRNGRYEVRLPPRGDSGYTVTVRHTRYGRLYLDEMSPPYRSQSLARRQDEHALLYSVAILHVPISLEAGKTELQHDLILSRP